MGFLFLSAVIKRLHDVNLSGWFVVLVLATLPLLAISQLVITLAPIILVFIPSSKMNNKYGDQDYAGGDFLKIVGFN